MEIKRKFGFAVIAFCTAVCFRSDARTYPDVSTFTSSLAVKVERRAVLQDAVKEGELVRLSADGQLLAAGTGRTPIKLWDTNTGKLVAELKGTEGQSPRDFSPVDDRLLASEHLKSFSLYDLKTMTLKSYVELKKPLGSINLFERFSPDGELFLIDSERKVTVWETATARMLSARPCGELPFVSTFSPDSKTILSACRGHKATLWDAQTGNVIAEFAHKEKENILLATFSADSKTVMTVADNGQVKNWDAASGRLKDSWASQESIFDATLSPDGKVLGTVGWNGKATLWDVGTQREKHFFRVSRKATSIHFSPDSKFVSANGWAGEVSVCSVADGAVVLNITGHEKEVRYVFFSQDSRVAVSYSSEAVNVWDLDAKTLVAKLSDARGMALLSQDGKLLVTGGPKGTLILWDIKWSLHGIASKFLFIHTGL